MVDRPALQRPVLVAAFRGWNDGGQGATLAAGYLAKIWDAERFADIDPENFIDFQANRPHVSLDEGLTRRIEWPENAFYHASHPRHDARRRPAPRRRAQPALADVQQARRRPGARP